MVVALAHFIGDGTGAFEPTEFALSRWGTDTLNGPAIVGLAARSLESEYSMPGFLPARLMSKSRNNRKPSTMNSSADLP